MSENIRELINKMGGVSAVAKRLGISRQTIYNRIKNDGQTKKRGSLTGKPKCLNNAQFAKLIIDRFALGYLQGSCLPRIYFYAIDKYDKKYKGMDLGWYSQTVVAYCKKEFNIDMDI